MASQLSLMRCTYGVLCQGHVEFFLNCDCGIWEPEYRSRTDVFVAKPGKSVHETGGRQRNALFQVSDQTSQRKGTSISNVPSTGKT